MTALPAGEPELGPWTLRSVAQVAEEVLACARAARAASSRRGPLVVAVDGRSASGKSTLGAALQGAIEGSSLVHTDDVAWEHSFFDWHQLLVSGVLRPLAAGHDVAYRPQAWVARRREGAIGVSATTRVLVIEGVGASRQELTAWLDAALWVQSDVTLGRTRGIARDISLGRSPHEAERFWDEWMAEEQPFLARDRPWARADLAVLGTAGTDDAGPGQLLVSAPRRALEDRPADPAP
ncbi:MAG: hypothetical protein ABI890_04705, partial [Lapillicoccus sp.]